MQAAVATQTVNDLGQITLGQHFAGQTVTVESVGEGSWHIHTAEAISAEQRSRQRLAFLESGQAVMRTGRGQVADSHIREMRENDRL